MRLSRGYVVIALAFGLVACATNVPASSQVPDALPVSYKAMPLSSTTPGEKQVGALLYRGGLEISADDPRFGGLSGLIVSRDGARMLAQSDEAHWFRANLLYDAKGNLSGIRDAQLAGMTGMDAKPMHGKEGDAEGLTALSPAGPDGPVAVSFERNHRIWAYDLGRGLAAKPEPIATPPDITALKSNSGLEGLARLPSGELLAIAEMPQSKANEIPAWLIPYPVGISRTGETLAVEQRPPYEISDAATDEDGDLFLLERHYFGPVQGVVIAVRRVSRVDVKPGAQLSGTVLAEFTMRENIDNMEGIAVRRGANGNHFVYLISDDNYNRLLQRTLLLMFEIVPQ